MGESTDLVPKAEAKPSIPPDALDEALTVAMSALRGYAAAPRGEVALTPAQAAIRVLDVVAPILVAAGRAQAATDIRAHLGPDPSPASPVWWAGYTEAISDCAKIAAGSTERDERSRTDVDESTLPTGTGASIAGETPSPDGNR